ncbi:lipase [Rhodococcus sp. SRB_17]|uniref:lipase family protein n=1 Tax=Rhodococcus sp. OK302 TaxID=1882769 RepID=UPI000B93C6CC|nr:lipase family protein [Rhodococcus sp. OK302]NMM90870.1 lipase [Rhodococcus sp. SRB_17]OYD70196.1 secretory lipase [Rhodococcus sp. OK302]
MLTTALLSLALTTGHGMANAVPAYPAPDPDPFYAQTEAATGPVGTPISVRRAPDLPTFPGASFWQVSFRSTNSENNPIVAVTTVLVPANQQPDGPLLSYQHIVNALGSECAPSRTLYTSDPNKVFREAPVLNVALQRGWTIALPDHLGPNSAYGAARLGGQITLDGIRAVQKVPELRVASSPVGIAGYSGGGMATAWAAALAPTYAPEINLVGVAQGGVPMNIGKMANALGQDPHPAFGLAFAAAMGLEREYPSELPLSNELNAAGRAMEVQLTNACTNDILVAGAGRSARQVTDSIAMLTSPQAVSVMNANSVELYPGVPTAPIFEWHSPTDALIPVDSVLNTNARYCAAGATVESQLYPSPDHLTTAVLGLPDAFDYLQDRFDGKPAPSNC